MGQCNETKEDVGGNVQKANVFSFCGCFNYLLHGSSYT